ncbi:hypothetical protein [Burkholderia multivorans]|uniref:hypothetical protein n=1 Tax=Burkholderia multivorans TaxID=87883 RepID=UPI00159293A6|nr:hypothetical protein [Burkholderia multivorans]MCA8336091.1 hypothetical protein [Burkholderia multivorans]UXZ60334.1 hypothetical protein NUJ28_12595 [Burkholderia multivorans]
MTDFKQAFIQGQRAVQQAHEAKSEINAIFDQLSRDVMEITNGVVLLSLEELTKAPYSYAVGSIMAAASKLIGDTERFPTEPWITARNTSVEGGGKRTKLAIFEEAETGYPLLLRYGKTEERCHDRVALERALAAFIAAPSIGERLMEVLDQNVQQSK